ncbi:hypothetical protein ADK58_07910 [Streptomyces sp. XY152]|nr:hypothetical protein ADK58_07910 [Streptomyces sp. XY152]
MRPGGLTSAQSTGTAKTIIERVDRIRLDHVTMPAAPTRRTPVEAGHHVRHRSAFGARPADQVAEGAQAGARRLVERTAPTLQDSLLVRHAPPAVADAFCATRLGGYRGHAFGTPPAAAAPDAIPGRALPDGGRPAGGPPRAVLSVRGGAVPGLRRRRSGG